ncbi:DNA methyltransferase [bacterium]|nr:MAG: DNA methyltransferase [bacterium]
MSLLLIQQYHSKVEEIMQYGGSRNETAIRPAFQKLLEQYCADKKLELIMELGYKTPFGTTVSPDGTLKDALRQDWGYWESKDQYDSLDYEIQKKLEKGYPTTNILFEDSRTAVLIQKGHEVSRASFEDHAALHNLITTFVNYAPKEVQTFREAIEKFKEDLPDLIAKLRQLIEEQAVKNATFAKARENFLELCRESINPHIVMADIREMIIQHVLTEDIFITVFNESQFHRENNIARSLMGVIETFFKGAVRKSILHKIDPYIQIIKAAAANIVDHHEKQRFLKVFYENFYRTYNPAAADRLGIMYTPNEIVRFMVESSDYLVHKHFKRLLADKDVEILDPATGTGTFITEIIEYLAPNRLPYKYENEIHCNEVAILPYYIANLNIEYTYSQKMGEYAEFKNICFVDTLDNLGYTYKSQSGKQGSLGFISLTAENLERIKRQNKRRISVIIGNPPYNANQLNENENNKNREYPGVDKRIKDTYVAESTAQKTKLYDMYARFIRWASDRLDKNGVLAFITNRSLIDARTYDGFRKVVADEFSDIYIIDLGGDVRKNPKLSGPKHNIFAIQTGVAISFFVRNEKEKDRPCGIFYTRRPETETAREKLHFLATTRFKDLPFEHIQPDKDHNWINLAENEWGDLLPVASKEVKLAKDNIDDQAIFKLFSLGVVTARDEWVYDFDVQRLKDKVKYFCEFFEKEKVRWNKSDKKATINDFVDRTIKWTSELEDHLTKGSTISFNPKFFKQASYRPFIKRHFCFDHIIVHRTYQQPDIFGIAEDHENVVICVNVGNKPFNVLATDQIPDYHFNGDSQCFPLYRYDKQGKRSYNITDWALKQFQSHYKDKTITRLNIFHYVYAILHDPTYRDKYGLNLKREFPRISFYEDFQKWATWGKQLMDLHIGYENVKLYSLKRVDKKSEPGKPPVMVKPVLKTDKINHTIELDSVTTLRGIPPEAWEYRLGNRSAIEWVLEYHKEHKPKDPTIREKFNTYRFADYKKQVIDLLQRVCMVSIETMKIVNTMKSGA